MTPIALARFVLVPYARTAVEPVAPVRRFRLARVNPPGRAGHDRFDHLKRSYD